MDKVFEILQVCLYSPCLDITYLSQPTSKTPFCPQATGMAQWILQKWWYFSHRHTIQTGQCLPGNWNMKQAVWPQITFQALPDVASCDSKGMCPFLICPFLLPVFWGTFRVILNSWILETFTRTKEASTSQVDPGPSSHQRTPIRVFPLPRHPLNSKVVHHFSFNWFSHFPAGAHSHCHICWYSPVTWTLPPAVVTVGWVRCGPGTLLDTTFTMSFALNK